MRWARYRSRVVLPLPGRPRTRTAAGPDCRRGKECRCQGAHRPCRHRASRVNAGAQNPCPCGTCDRGPRGRPFRRGAFRRRGECWQNVVSHSGSSQEPRYAPWTPKFGPFQQVLALMYDFAKCLRANLSNSASSSKVQYSPSGETNSYRKRSTRLYCSFSSSDFWKN